MQSRDPQAVTLALEPAISVMEEAELEVVLANLYGEALADIPLTGSAFDAAFRLGMLSPSYEIVAKARKPRSQDEAMLIGVAKGSTVASAARQPWQSPQRRVRYRAACARRLSRSDRG